MKEIITTLTSKGQVTIPAEIRRALGLKARDRVAFVLTPDGAKVRPAPSALDRIAGSVKPRKKPEDFKELRAIVKEEVARKVLEEM
ncbi:MAG: type II toxin-antitoxin system PrlF family antitoxin [Chloroflexota bacterium]|nr:type II toxin-antitoxin system PrlF family antitoxin [Chloroflexota bacterium]